MFHATGGTGDGAGDDSAIGRGTRRRKIAGYLKAANELRQSYQSTWNANHDDPDNELANIPGAFPNLKVSRNGTEEMVLFPSYARRHVRTTHKPPKPEVAGGDDLNREPGDAEYWRREWEIHEDANAVVDVDVRGWIYTPQRGAMSRRNRLLMSVARRLSGVPSPGDSQPSSRSSSVVRGQSRRDDELADREVQELMARGEREADVAGRGGYSEQPSTAAGTSNRTASPRPGDIVHPVTGTSLDSEPGTLNTHSSWTQPSEMSVEELAIANNHLVNRLRPFMTTPCVGMALTIFFYNADTSQSRSTRTNDSGHFNFRAALDFVPTSIRVLASETLSTSEEVVVTESKGVSVISDIDDTVKHSAISAGAREIFRNAFIRNLRDLTIVGVKEWYWRMSELGVQIHYVSNSPWQMYPVLDSFFAEAGLPRGSYHLKQYTGMLQGIFEPVAERKRGTIDRLLSDFPERQFILVGDSGEADLEVYTETALMNPGRILGIFIRDVTTDPKRAFFDSNTPPGASPSRQPTIEANKQDPSKPPPPLPPRRGREASEDLPHLGDLIDFSDSDAEAATGLGLPASLRPRPAPPSKPLALRSKSDDVLAVQSPPGTATPASDSSATGTSIPRKSIPPPPPKPRRLNTNPPATADPNPKDFPSTSMEKQAPPPPPPRRALDGSSDTATTSNSSTSTGTGTTAAPPPLPPRLHKPTGNAAAALQYVSRKAYGAEATSHDHPQSSSSWKMWNGQDAGTAADTAAEKRLELWQRRWARAKAVLGPKGIVLRTWRVGSDAEKIAEQLIKGTARNFD